MRPVLPQRRAGSTDDARPAQILDTPQGCGQKINLGTLQSLKAEGYKTALYLPFTLLAEWENWVFKSLGFQRVMIAEEVTDQRWVGLRGLDGVALETLKEDVARWVKQGERFIAAFLPQIGHAPWPDLLDNNIKDDLAARGRYVVSLQDKWLGETVDLLEQLGQLDRTLIIVTSDHGIRTAFEDPSFTRGRLDEYSFHVPFLLYAPEVLSTTQQIDWVSSHLDVIPSVLDLLGIDAGRDFEQGSPLWNPELRERRTYFWAESMAASDGYYAMGRYSMWNRILDSVYVNETLYFEAPHQVSRGSSVHQEVVTNVSQMAELQRLWLAKALRKNP